MPISINISTELGELQLDTNIARKMQEKKTENIFFIACFI